MPTLSLNLRYNFDADLQRFNPRQNKSRIFQKIVMSYFQRLTRDCRTERVFTTGTQEKIGCLIADDS